MLYGRDAELSAVHRLLNDARSGCGGALVLRGVPGIGKSAVLAEARAAAADLQVLTSRGIEAEADLPFAGVHQLLRPVQAEIDGAADPRRGALQAAFGSALESSHQRFLVYSECLNALSDVAARSPLVCLVDDAHWLDSASAESFQFCARRLAREPIAMLFAVRGHEGSSFGADLPSMTLDPLPPDVAASLLRRTADITDGVADRLLDQARGNPLALLELPRALTDAQLAGVAPLPDRLPLTAQLEASYATRVERLAPETQRLLLLAAVDDSEDVRVIVRAAEKLGLDPSALDDAERAGLVRVEGAQLDFSHPLIRSALHGLAASGDRRRAHQALAEALADDPEHLDRRAWHLATAGVAPIEVVIQELEDAADRAQRRGGHVAAARALERAGALSPEPDARASRLVRAAHHLSRTGRDEAAMGLTADVDERLLAPVDRATLAFVRASAAIRWRGRPADVIADLLATARELAPEHPSLTIQLLPVVMFAAWQSWDHEAQLDVAAIAATIDIERLRPADRQLAVSLAGFAAMLRGDRSTAGVDLGETIRWGRTVDDAHQAIWSAWAALWLGDDHAFEQLLRHAIVLARRHGEIGALTEALGMQSVQLALIAQRFEDASIAADEAMQMALELGADTLTLLPRSALAIIAAVEGRADVAREHGDGVVRLHRERGHPFRASPALYALALVEMADGEWSTALDLLTQIKDPNDPALSIVAPEIVEAAVRSGEPGRATAAFELYERRVEESGSVSLLPRLEACRALLVGPGDADAHFELAVEALPAARPFDAPRVRLLYGEHLRRHGRRLEGREHLRAAVDGFDLVGAVPWAERARRELSATGETARRRTPEAVTQLTSQELQIARLVASGLTNKEVAAQLFLSPRTIDAHLRSVFAKLGITSRRDLRSAQLLAEHELQP